MITTTTRREQMALAARKLPGCGYVWGARGEVCTQALLNRLAKQYPDQTNILSVCPKWIGKPVYDCATLVRACLAEAGIEICSGASSQWRGDYWESKGEIADMPRDKPCVLYNESASANPMGHTGIYLGDGWVVDARGSREGVLLSRLDSRPWSHYAVPRGADEPVQIETATVRAESGSTVRLRKGPSKSTSTLAKVPLGTEVAVLGRETGWARIVAGGNTGYMMLQFLDFGGGEGGNQPEAATYTITLLDATEAERAAIVAACGRVTVERNVG